MTSHDLRQYMADIPVHDHQGLLDYLFLHIPTGGFLRAVLSNDLKEACLHADDENRYALWNIVAFLCNHAPSDAWGSAEKYTAWMERK